MLGREDQGVKRIAPYAKSKEQQSPNCTSLIQFGVMSRSVSSVPDAESVEFRVLNPATN